MTFPTDSSFTSIVTSSMGSHSTPSTIFVIALGLLTDTRWVVAFGGAARSELRQRLQPKVLAKAEVANAGYRVTERTTAKPAGAGPAATTYFNARARVAVLDAADFQVAEAFEALI